MSDRRAEDVFPLTPMQRGMLYHSLAEPDSAVYVEQQRMVLDGLDPRAFRQSWERVSACYPALRTSVVGTGRPDPAQVVWSQMELPWHEHDCRGLSDEEQEAWIASFLEQDRVRGFRFDDPSLLHRFMLIRLAEARYEFVWTVHHLLVDGWGGWIVQRDAFECYEAARRGGQLELSPPRPFSDYVAWLRRQDLSAAEAYFKGRLGGLAGPTRIGGGAPGSTITHYEQAGRRLSAELTRALREVGKRSRVSLNTVMQGAWALLLSRYSGDDDVIFGTVVSGRPEELDGVQSMVGMFVNTLPFRIEVPQRETLGGWLQAVQARQLELRGHEHSPLWEIQRWSPLSGDTPLFESIYVFENIPLERPFLGPGRSVQVEMKPTLSRIGYPLQLMVFPDRELFFNLVYDADLFPAAAIEGLLTSLQTLLEGFASAAADQPIAELPILTRDQQRRILVDWNATDQALGESACVHELFESQAEADPDAVAVRDGAGELSYGELNRRANQLAHHLRSLGVGPDTRVAILLPRSADVAVALLASLKAGGAYVPLDPELPHERVAWMLEDSDAAVVLTEAALASRFRDADAAIVCVDRDAEAIAAASEADPARVVTPDHLAYVLFTSGSTGRPKGLAMPHAALVNLLRWQIEASPPGAAARTAQFGTLSFDQHFLDIFATLAVGGTVLVVSEEQRRDPQALLRFLDENAVTRLFMPYVAMRQMAEVGLDIDVVPRSLRLVISAGEPLQITDHIARFFQRLPECVLCNQYGPAETQVVTAQDLSAPAREWPAQPSIGAPIANTRIYILDPYLLPVPVGATGELYIGGAPLSRCYLGAPAETAERFVCDPHTGEPGARLYRSGDLGRYRPDGTIEFLGRTDFQVKIRGYRIEPGEIEATATRHPDVQHAVVAAREDLAGARRLVLYVTPQEGRATLAEGVRTFLRERLPDYMVPAAIVALDAFPLTATGKVDRLALPEPGGDPLQPDAVGPRSFTEQMLVGIWVEVLGAGAPDVHRSFFDLGGHSLLATQVIARVRQVLGVDLPVRAVFEEQTIAKLARRIEALRGDGAKTPDIVASARESAHPLSHPQRRLWLLDQLGAGTAYNLPVTLRLRGPLQRAALERSLTELVRRHDVLRTRFARPDDEPVQIVTAPGSLALPVEDLTGLPEPDREPEARRLAATELERPFDLASDALLRARLIELAADDHVLLLVTHHIVADGWSIGVLLRELSLLYEAFVQGAASPLEELALRYADYAAWQRAWMTGPVLERHLEYWRAQLTGAATLALPTDHPRGAIQTHGGAQHSFQIPEDLAGALERLGQQENTTLFMTLLAAFGVLLSRYSGQSDIVIGTPVANRPRVELENLIGFFINTLVLRTDLSGDPTFRELLARVRETSIGAYQHQDVPFEVLVDELEGERDPSRNPLYQVTFTLQNTPLEDAELHGLALSWFAAGGMTTRSDLELHAKEDPDGLHLSLVYNLALFSASTVERMARHYEQLLRAVVEDSGAEISAFTLLTEAERDRLLTRWEYRPAPSSKAARLDQRFERQVERSPDAVAVTSEGSAVTYAELNARANQLAHLLRSRGAGPDVLVGLCVERSLELVVGVLGILKAGGAYVPIDPANPAERIAFFLGDTGLGLLVTEQSARKNLPEHDGVEIVSLDGDLPELTRQNSENPESVGSPESLAYVIYTSGSTGTPKGVLVEHRHVARLFDATDAWFGFDERDVWTLFHSFAFDFSVWELWGALLHGGRLVVVPFGVSRSPDDFYRLLVRERVTVLNQTPSAFRQLMRADEEQRAVDLALRLVVFGGEALDIQSLRPWFERHGDSPLLVNMYGITETTVHVTYRPLSAQDLDRAPGSMIGRPIPDLRAYVLDEHRRLVPTGVPGELYVGGAGVARGYLDRDALTAERFVDDPFHTGDRLYRTGDRVRTLEGGDLEYLGRLDDQVKIRGYRIELGEIESVLRQHPGVSDAAVLAREDRDGARRLLAYLVPAGADNDELRVAVLAWARERLPDYMVPSSFTMIDSIPLTRNGKADRRALMARVPAIEERESSVAPRSELERRIAAIWREVLGTEQVGVRDGFFDLGGDSLRLVSLRAKLALDLDCEISVTDLFRYTTVEALAAHLGGSGSDSSRRRDAEARAGRRGGGGDGAAEPIAVIAAAGRFPGAQDVETFWANLCDGVEGIRFFTPEEMRSAGVDEVLLSNPDFVSAHGALDGADLFDARLFRVSPREAEVMDPQQRIFLECAWQALERAGYDPERYDGLIGVYSGGSNNSYLANLQSHPEIVAGAGPEILVGGKDYLSTRASYKLNLRGPSMTVQTACSTSLVAVHEACDALLAQRCDIALAGGVCVTVPLVGGYVRAGGLFSPDGHCRSFDAGAGGTLRGDGVGIVVLKRLAEAQRDGDQILALIRGTAINNDGSNKVGFVAPGVEGQVRVIAMAQAAAGVDPGTIGYVEAHGTATALGDPIEVSALTSVFRERTDRVGFCGLGSVKSNIGHLDAAAGVAALIKTVLALHHRRVPPSLHFEQANPELHLEDSPFSVVTECRDWTCDQDVPRRAGVSSFGIGGTNAHAVLEEAPAGEPSGPSRPWQLLTISARTGEALDAATQNLATFLRNGSVGIADAAHTLQVGRRELEHRRAVACRNVDEACRALDGELPEQRWTRYAPEMERSVVFLFPGHGHQYPDMGRGLYRSEAVFQSAVDECLAHLTGILDFDLRPVIFPDGEREGAADALMSRPSVITSAVFVIDYAMARLWQSWGIEPAACLGHSLGEYVAAALAGVLRVEDALRLVTLRGQLIEQSPPGAMLSVALPEGALLERLEGENAIWISIVNGPELCIVSGEPGSIDDFERRLMASGIECSRLIAPHGYHSPMLEGVVEPLRDAARAILVQPPRIPYLSNVTGDWITAAQIQDPEYWGRQTSGAVRFSDGINRLLEDPDAVLLEVGPGRMLGSLAKKHPACGRERLVVPSLRHPDSETSDDAYLTEALGRLWTGGVSVDWSRYRAGERRRRVTLPTYPFERQRYWIEPRHGPDSTGYGAGRRTDLAEWFYAPAWRRSSGTGASARDLGDAGAATVLVFAPDAGFGKEIKERLAQVGRRVVTVHAGAAFGSEGDAYVIDPSSGEDYVRLVREVGETHGALGDVLHLWNLTFEPDRPSDRAAERIRERGLYTLLHLLGALAQPTATSAPVRINVVTDGVHEVLGDETLCPEKAMIVGPCRIAALDDPNVTCRNIDLATGEELTGDTLEELVSELSPDATENMVAYRRGRRWVQSFAPVRLEALTSAYPSRLRPRGVYLITGGLGGMGLELALELARSVQARLVLTGRTALPDRSGWQAHVEAAGEDDPTSRRIHAVEAIESAGAEVMLAQADVTDPESMRSAVDAARSRFGRIHGVLHLAGVLGSGHPEPEHVEPVLAAKVTGTRILESLFADAELDFMVLASSLITSWGVPGQIGYCAANAYLDVFASRFAADTGTFTVAIDWNGWREAGMAADLAREQGVSTAGKGMSNEEGVEVFRRILDRCDAPQILVSEVEFRDPFQIRMVERVADSAWAAAEATPSGEAAPEHARPQLSTEFVAPRSSAERTLASIWQRRLGIEIGRNDNFFELGGDSVQAIHIVAAARDAGLIFTAKQLLVHPTIAALAKVASTSAGLDAEQGPVSGPLPLSPIQRWFFESDPLQPHHYNQALLVELDKAVDPDALQPALDALLWHHDALRQRFRQVDGDWHAEIAPPGDAVALEVIDLGSASPGALSARIESEGGRIQASFDLAAGPIIRAALLRADGEGDRLLIAIHHACVDAMSWSILLEDLARGLQSSASGQQRPLPRKTTSVRAWAEQLTSAAQSAGVSAMADAWLGLPWDAAGALPRDLEGGENTVASSARISVALTAEETEALLGSSAARVRIDDILLTALAPAVAEWTSARGALLDLEGLGREDIDGRVDVSRTVGWFTALHPILLEVDDALDRRALLERVRDRLAWFRDNEQGYRLARYLSNDETRMAALRSLPRAEIAFVYLGRFDLTGGGSPFVVSTLPLGPMESPDARRQHLLEINSAVSNGCLQVHWTYSQNVHTADTIGSLSAAFLANLRELIATRESGERSWSYDVECFGWSAQQLENILARLEHGDPEDIFPLTPLQRGMMFHVLSEPGSGVYVEHHRFPLDGLDAALFRQAWEYVYACYAPLRTSIVTDGRHEPAQVVWRQVELPWREHDCRELAEEEQEAWISAYLEQDRARGLGLDEPSLARFMLVRRGDAHYELVLTVHHIILDGWSASIVFPAAFACYEALRRGEAPELPLPRPFRDYIAWLYERNSANAEAYWRRRLAGVSGATTLDAGIAQRAVTHYGESQDRLSEALTRALLDRAAQCRVTLNTLVQCAWAFVLSRYSGEDEVIFGTVVSGRPDELEGVQSMVGMFINTVPFCVDVPAAATLTEWLQSMQAMQLEQREHEHCALWEIQRWSEFPAGAALFESLFVFENHDPAALRKSDSQPPPSTLPMLRVGYPLMLQVGPSREMILKITYDADRYERAAVEGILRHASCVLEQFATKGPQKGLDSITLLAPEERTRLTEEWNRTDRAYATGSCLHGLFELQATQRPDATAVIFGDERWTYAELNGRANQLAHRLRDRGIAAGDLVGICLERSADMVAGLLGILKTGAAYVPLDPAFPAERLRFMLEDSGTAALVADDHALSRVAVLGELARRAVVPVLQVRDGPSAARPWSTSDLALPVDSEQLAYVIYTSGSTGLPKGVQVSHRNVVNFLVSMSREPGIETADALLSVTTLSFDIAALELFLPLVNGARVEIASRSTAADGAQLAERLGRGDITIMQATPATWQMLVEAGWKGGGGLRMLCGGEALPRALAEQLLLSERELWNLYGPTETTIWSTIEHVTAAGSAVPIGRGIANTRVYVLDSRGDPAPVGIPGELHIGGDGVARGYLGRPALTAERFVPDPFAAASGQRLYATGDLVRYRPDGRLEFVGRVDTQIKLRGHRIELGEIESVAVEHAAVRQAAAVVRDDRAQDRRLVLYVVPSGEAPSPTELRRFLGERLPDAMLPSAYVSLDALPMTANRKVDRRALPAPASTRTALDQAYVAPRSATEGALCDIWSEVLGLDEVGIHHDFFELGGHSLLAMRAAAAIQESFDLEFDLHTFLTVRTVAEAAAEIDARAWARSAAGAAQKDRTREPAVESEEGTL